MPHRARALQVALEEMGRRARVLVRRAAVACRERSREALVVRLDRNVDDVAQQRSTNASVSSACAPRSPRSVSGMPDDDAFDLVLEDERRAARRARPRSRRARRRPAGARSSPSHPRRRRRCARRRSRARAPSQRRDDEPLGLGERVRQLLGILPTGARHRRPPATSAADDRGRSAHDVGCAHLLGDGRRRSSRRGAPCRPPSSRARPPPARASACSGRTARGARRRRGRRPAGR